jgi:translation initiation factor 2B subunit (eIF-2B alpha/beta/delta family)
VDSIKTSLAEMGIEGEEAEKAIKGLAIGLDQVADKKEELKRSAQEIENLKEQVKYFFSLTNAIDLFKRTVS